MRIMLFGKNGKLGKTFVKLHHIDYAFSHKELDITDRDKVLKLIEMIKPNIIINCAAIADIDYCEQHPDEAWKVNVDGVENICDGAKKVNAYVVHFSSDAAINPVNVYGKTKLASESLVEGLVVRLTLYNKDDWIVKSLLNHKKVNAFTDVYLNPISTVFLIRILFDLIKIRYKGIINIGTKERINMFEFGKHIVEVFELPKNLLTPSSCKGQKVKRRKERFLPTHELEKLKIHVPSIMEDLKTYKKEDVD